jgi:hypothetical protein
MRRALAVAVVLAGLAVQGAASAAPARTEPQVVVAVVDNGIDAYHADFAQQRDVRRQIPGYPLRQAKALQLSLHAPNYAAARAADDRTWSGLVDRQLYYVPGTKIVGLVHIPGRGPQDSANQISVDTDPSAGHRPVIDDAGHGTSAASLAVGARHGRCKQCLLVFVSAVNLEDGLRWAAAQPWIDVISNSWGGPLGVPIGGSAGPAPTTGQVEQASKLAAASGKIVFFAGGNGLSGAGPYAGAGVDRGLTWTSPYSGPPWVTAVGGYDPRSHAPTGWHDVPVDVVADAQEVPAAQADSFSGERAFIGTSAATPLAAGTAAEALLLARRELGDQGGHPGSLLVSRTGRPGPLADRRLTRGELADAILHAASPLPASSAVDSAVVGWGRLEDATAARIAAILTGRSAAPARPEAQSWYADNTQVRVTLWGAPPP